MVLPGHRRLINDHQGRIRELKKHHRARLDEVRSILNGGSAKHAFQVASEMTWDLQCDTWDDFPIAQKWFATGEAIAHLNYLENEGLITRTHASKITLYKP